LSHCLVIGGTLFIGRALVRRLLGRGDRVTILHRGKANPFAGKTDEIHCDRNEVEAVRSALAGRRFDVVYDNVYDWQRGTTAEQVQAAAEACRGGLTRYIFTSSVAAYEPGENLTEDAALAPLDSPDLYARNKANTERMLFRLHRESGFPAVTLRPPYIYGPENPFYREAFFWDRLLRDRPIIIPSDGLRGMQFVLADDLARAAILAAETNAASGRAYNVANPTPVSQRQLVDELARACGRTPKRVHISRSLIERAGGKILEPPFYFGQYFDMPPISQDVGRASRELGFEATPFDAGLAATFEAYSKETRPEPDFSWEDRLFRSLQAD
jgi:nucleoside-diphosphate-sugar epimerase